MIGLEPVNYDWDIDVVFNNIQVFRPWEAFARDETMMKGAV
ncbi:hypothetical protein [Roseobacter sp.]